MDPSSIQQGIHDSLHRNLHSSKIDSQSSGRDHVLARMLLKPEKSSCLLIEKEKVTAKFKLFKESEEILSLNNSPIKCLGKWINSTLKDSHSQERLKQQVGDGLRRIDKSELPGKFHA